MATYEVTDDNIRLDEVVMQVFGNLDQFDAVLSANPDLTQVFLTKATKLVMPTVAASATDEVLW